MMHEPEKSDSVVVAAKPTNKAVRSAAEPVERRTHSGFSILILRIRSRTSLPIRGRPQRGRDFHHQYAAKPIRCQCTTVSALTMVTASRMRG